jgi:hypothetical protein
MKTFNGVYVTITPTSDYPTPYGLEYAAKGCYVQKKNIIIVGHTELDNTIRIKYPLKDVTVKVKYTDN